MQKKKEFILNNARDIYIKQCNKTSFPYFIVIKITEDCNLRCEYCYAEGGRSKKVIEINDVISLFDQIAEGNSGNIVCLFHGGEPLLHIGVIKKIIETIKPKYYSPRISYRLQTNGTIINDEIIKVIKKYNIFVGISLDGYKELNDVNRKKINGTGTFDLVLNTITILRKNNIDFGILNLITKTNVNYIEEILEFYNQNEISNLAFSIFSPSGYGKINQYNLTPTEDDLIINIKKEIKWLITTNKNRISLGKKAISEREIKFMALRIKQNGKCSYMCKSIPCGAGIAHISLEVGGNINICDSLYGYQDCIIGNIKNQTLTEMMNHPIIELFQNRNIDKIKKCQKCSVNKYCSGGCPAENIIVYNKLDAIYQENYNCSFLFEIYSFLYELYNNSKEDFELLCC